MDEDVAAAVVLGDEAEALLLVEPLDGAGAGHLDGVGGNGEGVELAGEEGMRECGGGGGGKRKNIAERPETGYGENNFG